MLSPPFVWGGQSINFWFQYPFLFNFCTECHLLTCNITLVSELHDSLFVPFVLLFFIFTVDTITDVPNFPSPFAHLHPSPTLSSGQHHTVGCTYGSGIYVLWLIPSPSFIQSPLSSLSSDSCQSAPCVHAYASILFISLFCSLDSTCKWDHMILVFFWLAYFTLRKLSIVWLCFCQS